MEPSHFCQRVSGLTGQLHLQAESGNCLPHHKRASEFSFLTGLSGKSHGPHFFYYLVEELGPFTAGRWQVWAEAAVFSGGEVWRTDTQQHHWQWK